MRPDRIIVGECRGAEALDMLQAMNTGHNGSLTTIHANTTRDAIQRLEVLVQMADAKLPILSIHRQIVSAIDIIVQLSRLGDHSRRVTQVTEVIGLDEATGELRLRDLFVLCPTTPGAPLRATGHLPSFMSELMEDDRTRLKLNTFYSDETWEDAK
jgi:pilus assembly protein CpaF